MTKNFLIVFVRIQRNIIESGLKAIQDYKCLIYII